MLQVLGSMMKVNSGKKDFFSFQQKKIDGLIGIWGEERKARKRKGKKLER